ARQPADDDSSCSGTLSLSSRSHFRSRALIHRAYSANASLAPSSFNLAISPRTRLSSSASAMANAGSLHISSPAVVLDARQSKFGSFSISIRSSVSFNRQALADWTAWLLTLCCLKTPQLELRSLIHSAFSSTARRRSGSRFILSWTALLSLAEAALSSGSPQ